MTHRIITVGKAHGLYRTSTQEQVFTIIALDQQDVLRKALNSNAPMSVTDQEITDFKLDAAEILSPHVSGILLDPVWGVAQAIERGIFRRTGLLIELEKADYGMRPLPLDTALRPGWNTEKTKRIGADGVKLFFYYHPDDLARAVSQEALVSRIVDEAAVQDIPFFAEPIAYPPANGPAGGSPTYAEDFPRVVVESARRTAALGVDVLKLEFPVDVRHQPDEAAWLDECQRLTAAIDIPWVLLSAGVDFETFQRQVEVACQAGASGFIAGRSVWGDACAIQDRQERRAWLEHEGLARAQRLVEIVRAHALPWTAHYSVEPVSSTWFASYGEPVAIDFGSKK
jgi:tagatose-1,6-bisphosphate aldolase